MGTDVHQHTVLASVDYDRPMWWALATALAGTVTLHVGVHADAGSIHDIAVDGASGQCRVEPAQLVCPAEDTVTFRWGPPTEDWVLVGDTVLEPGEGGKAWVLAPEAQRANWRARLLPQVVVPQDVRDAFLRQGRIEPPSPSFGMLRDLNLLVVHSDPEVRKLVAEAIHALAAGSSSNPFPRDAPLPLAPGVLSTLASDRDWRVRIRVAQLMGEIRNTGLRYEVVGLLDELTHDKKPLVRRAAIRGLGRMGEQAMIPPEDAWERAMRLGSQPKGPGRASMYVLARLANHLEPSERVDPAAAVELALEHHPELAWVVWKRWRGHLPYDGRWVRQLLANSAGMNPIMLERWADEDPDDLALAFIEFEPATVQPATRRFRLAQWALFDTEHAGLRHALRLDVDPPPPPGEPRPTLRADREADTGEPEG